MGEFSRVVWLPAYGMGAVLAAGLLVYAQVVALNCLPCGGGVAAAGILLSWAAFYAILLSAEERAMFRADG